MTLLQKLQLRQSELRQKISGLLELETRSDTQQADLDTATREMRSLEGDIQAAILIDTPIETRKVKDDKDGKEMDQTPVSYTHLTLPTTPYV